MAKRSPILGYNHNVRYRGLMWHVQTEDSGLANPHLFSHLFHEGVIVSTRKLVYDSGSDEGAIKSLMQAQHKAVMKDLKRGHFDDKIDLYLHGTEGLLPRGGVEDAGDKPAAVAPVAAAVAPAPTLDLDALDPPTLRQDPPAIPARPMMPSDLAPSVRGAGPASGTPRTVTMDRTSGPSSVRSALLEADLPETASADMAAAVAAANTTMRQLVGVDSSAEIEIRLELEAEEPGDGEGDPESELDPSRTSSRRRAHDTEISISHDPTRSDVPTMVADDATRPNVASDAIPSLIAGRERSQPESIPPLPAPPERRPTKDHPAVGAASLPPARPITRPPSRAVTPQSIMPRPQSESDARRRTDADSVEVYAPAPPSADTPPGMSERPGQYAQHRRVTNSIPNDIVRSDRSGGIPAPAIPAGLAKPRPVINPPATGPIPRPISREQSPPPPIPSLDSVPHVVRVDPASSSGPVRSRTTTPARIQSPASRPTPGGVVMTRPAVIVGAPAKPTATSRIRKAREEEGRGFGQGLISEKSLDEVILAYLSEDADEK